ncbi:metal ABC transporter solute-binding protein, Zn/Mn family [Thermococcus sp.]
MKEGNFLVIIMIILLLIPLTGTVSAESQKPLVVTTISPLAGIVTDAFGDSVRVEYIIPPGADPHEYQLTTSQIELLQKADVIVTTGGHLPIEKKIAELQKEGVIRGRALFIDDYKRNGFRYLKEHWYNDKDNPHGVWADPYNALAIAKATEEALMQADPANAETYEVDYESFKERVLSIVLSYRALVKENTTAVIQMPPDQYAIEWLGIKAVAAIKPEEEVPAIGVDSLVKTAMKTSMVVYTRESSDQLKSAAKELAAKSGKPTAEVSIFWSDKPYTQVLIENSAAVVNALGGKVERIPVGGTDVTTYVIISLLVGLVLGTAIGVILKK